MQETTAATALAVLELVRTGRFEEIRDLFAVPLRPMVSSYGAARRPGGRNVPARPRRLGLAAGD